MSSTKSIFSDLGIGTFYLELANWILSVCAKFRDKNGGMMNINEIINIYKQKFQKEISKNDVIKSVE